MTNSIIKFDLAMNLFFVVLLAILAGFSPVLGAYAIIIYLSLGLVQNSAFRIIFSILIIISFSAIIASKNYAAAAVGDDFSMYYRVFQWLLKGDSIFVNDFAGGIEFLLPVYFKLLQFFGGNIAPSRIIFFECVAVTSLFYIWVEVFAIKNESNSKKNLAVAAVFLFYSFIVTGQYMRQVFACVFILYSLSLFYENKKIGSLIFGSLSIFSHTSSIVILPIYFLIIKGGRKTHILMIILSFLCSVFFSFIISFVLGSGLLGAAGEKLSYYVTGDGANRDINFQFIFFLIAAFSFAYYFFKDNCVFFRNILFVGGYMYIGLIFIPVLPNRIFMIITFFIYGLLLFFSLYKSPQILKFIIVLYSIYRSYVLIFKLDFHHLPYSMASQALWYSYPWAGDYFLYYFF